MENVVKAIRENISNMDKSLCVMATAHANKDGVNQSVTKISCDLAVGMTEEWLKFILNEPDTTNESDTEKNIYKVHLFKEYDNEDNPLKTKSMTVFVASSDNVIKTSVNSNITRYKYGLPYSWSENTDISIFK